ncbi:hypothetical protein OBBRIDRAFT_887717 [Obba rivulosa]|uniref:Uncharacterized protein n=1 Tax=Obba rivulosa TaxID=1052685 RepID=A0A8E2AT46_9APHY|nr:hypothetical protein OBBRIDRAFT_887717 [Obba rivulosa]
MALTATAQSALPREPAWDEVIVPALRRRLKDESNVLAKRISAASIGSMEEQLATSTSRHGAVALKPSAIPRPSLSQTRPSVESSVRPQRSRTYSQPFIDFDPDASPPSDHLRSVSPAMNGKNTRIPISRARTGSTSSHARALTGDSYDPQDLYSAHEGGHSHTSRSTFRVPRVQTAELFREQAPIMNGDHDYSDPRRFSSDSEERPFEHWYRGDVSRNGGVGELRVGRREEMLDIANYGHTFRNAASRTNFSSYTRSRSNSRGRDLADPRGRQRAESVGATPRQSLYLDEDEHVQDSMVLDERPLTDAESDDYGEADYDGYSERDVMPHPNGNVSSPSLNMSGTTINVDTARHRQGQTSISRIPTPSSSRHILSPPRTPTPTSKPMRNGSEPGSSHSTPRSGQRVPRSQSQPLPQSQQNAKRRAKSPATASPASAAKKTKTPTKPPSAMQRKTPRKEESRRSIGQYPTPDGDDVVDAIPSWTQPVPSSGNWDDVVLPVVARKKGLDGHYATADGSPKQKPQNEQYEPAPGTFGYDHSKYRPPRAGTRTEEIPMDEFGERRAGDPQGREEAPTSSTEQAPSPTSPTSPQRMHTDVDRARHRPSPPPSPAPFAHYAMSTSSYDNTSPQMAQRPAAPQAAPEQHEPEDDSGGGCCKCVIM